MKTLTIYFAIIIFSGSVLAESSPAIRKWQQNIVCKDIASERFDLEVSAIQFPDVDVKLSWTDKHAQKREFSLSGHYGQNFDYTNNKQYYGYVLRFADLKSDQQKNMNVWIENSKRDGYADLMNPDITGTNQNLALTCTITEE